MAKIDFLKERAEDFLSNAKDLIKKGVYPLAAFNLEQSLQLYLKYYLYLKLKKYPKTHFLGELLRGIGKAYKKEKEIEKIIEKMLILLLIWNMLISLQDIYLQNFSNPKWKIC